MRDWDFCRHQTWNGQQLLCRLWFGTSSNCAFRLLLGSIESDDRMCTCAQCAAIHWFQWTKLDWIIALPVSMVANSGMAFSVISNYIHSIDVIHGRFGLITYDGRGRLNGTHTYIQSIWNVKQLDSHFNDIVHSFVRSLFTVCFMFDSIYSCHSSDLTRAFFCWGHHFLFIFSSRTFGKAMSYSVMCFCTLISITYTAIWTCSSLRLCDRFVFHQC